MSMRLAQFVVLCEVFPAGPAVVQEPLYPALAHRAVSTMKPWAGERVLIRADPKTFVRLSLGNNEELGGAVRGEGVMGSLFADATITVAGRTHVKGGKVTGTAFRQERR